MKEHCTFSLLSLLICSLLWGLWSGCGNSVPNELAVGLWSVSRHSFAGTLILAFSLPGEGTVFRPRLDLRGFRHAPHHSLLPAGRRNGFSTPVPAISVQGEGTFVRPLCRGFVCGEDGGFVRHSFLPFPYREKERFFDRRADVLLCDPGYRHRHFTGWCARFIATATQLVQQK